MILKEIDMSVKVDFKEYEEVSINDTEGLPTRIEIQAERVSDVAEAADIANKQKWIDRARMGGIFAAGTIFGSMNSALINEVSAKVYNYTVPVITREIPTYFSVTTLGVFAIVAVPIVLYAKGGFD